LRVELALGGSVYSVAAKLECDRTDVTAALRRHRITPPAEGLTRWERVEALSEPSERAAAARRIEVEATADAQQAMQIRLGAERDARRGERPAG
jgi:hypothetical protein